MRQNALLRSAKGLGIPGTARKKVRPVAVAAPVTEDARSDHFVVREGVRCAGVHLIVDLYEAQGLDDIDPPARVSVPPLMRGYLRLGAQVCGEPAHDPDFGVGDFPALLDKRQADTRYLRRLRSVGAAATMADGITS